VKSSVDVSCSLIEAIMPGWSAGVYRRESSRALSHAVDSTPDSVRSFERNERGLVLGNHRSGG
jgi:hypothetical protein